tara:strand:- start:12 stop:1031 length:1020 start_codon:yes stop_codon:yes gene_type:complete
MKNITPSIPTYVVSLERRQDRRDHFIEKNRDKVLSWSFYDAFDAIGLELTYNELVELGFDTDHSWKDPMDEQHLSVGGVGCFISHFRLWEICIKLNSPIMILEDDVVIEDEFNYQDIVDLIDEGYNLIYPGYAEQGDAKPVKGKTGFVIPDIAYWTSSYVITPDAAKILGNNYIKHNIIPVDEYISKKLSMLNPIAYEKQIMSQIPTSDFLDELGTSDVDAYWGCYRRYFQDYNIHSYNNKNNIQPLEEFIKYLPDHDVVIYYADEEEFKKYIDIEIGRRLLHINDDIIRKDHKKFMPDLKYGSYYFNSDLYVARVSKIKQMLNLNKINWTDTEYDFYE